MTKLSSFVLFFTLMTVTVNMSAQTSLFLAHDNNYMSKYLYRVDNFSNSNYHIAYHVEVSEFNKVIFNLKMRSYESVGESFVGTAQPFTNTLYSPALVQEINQGTKQVKVLFQEEGRFYTYEVSTAFWVEETPNTINYSGPFYSFAYEKQTLYDPIEDLEQGYLPNYEQTKFVADGKQKVKCVNAYNLIKIIRETHPKNSFTMVANTDFTRLSEAQVLAACQQPLQIQYLENIGIYREKTANGSLELISINGLPLEVVLETKCGITNTAITTEMPVPNPVLAIGNTAKGGSSTTTMVYMPAPVFREVPTEYSTVPSSTNSPQNPQLRFYTRFEDGNTTKSGEATKVIESKPIVQIAGLQTISAATTPPPIVSTDKLHVVDTGETLYSLSRKYNTTVQKIKQLNNLTSDTIYVTQKLIVRE